ncbi:MAG: phosphoenolpyruvate carboxykinase [Candidatus Eremiobacteraeota bacterium]|nr:phosphoenolpyruvate carboxykinase [Candidatus Eremiobacteraeota bacterium]
MNPFEAPVEAKSFIINPSHDQLRELARKDEKTTVYGSASYISKIRSRSARFTDIIFGDPDEEQRRILSDVQTALKFKTLIRLDRKMGLNPESSLHCRLYITEDYARVAYMWYPTLFDPDDPDGEPDITVVCVPEWPERRILVDAISHTTYAMGSDYTGEVKKANLRMAMYIAKCRGWLGLHAASKILRVKDKTGKLVEKGFMMFGLSGTGKTSLTCHPHGLGGEEGIIIRQDDVILLRDDLYCYGTEDNFYLKTDGLAPETQPILYKAAISPEAILENVFVDDNGNVDFFDDSLTSNGRGIVYRSEMDYTDDQIDLRKASVAIFITRRKDITPPVARLNDEQGAAFFMLGESIETSAGDPSQAGKSLRVVGTNPFIIGDEAEEGNRFYEILKANPDLQCFVLNTGRVGGDDGEKITIIDSATILREIARDTIKWKYNPDWGYEVPEDVPGVDMERFNLDRFYSDEEKRALTEQLRNERIEWLNKFPNLREEVKSAIPAGR